MEEEEVKVKEQAEEAEQGQRKRVRRKKNKRMNLCLILKLQLVAPNYIKQPAINYVWPGRPRAGGTLAPDGRICDPGSLIPGPKLFLHQVRTLYCKQ